MRSIAPVAGGGAVLLLGLGAWPFARPPVEADPPATEAPAAVVVPEPPPPALEKLFPEPVPVDIGALPEGLANASAQGCNACHFGAHDGWSQSAHARGAGGEAFRAAVATVGTPACTVCHLPLRVQHAEEVAYDVGRVDRPVGAANPSWDATLATEGVTCAACHLRGGKVVTARVVEGAPHATLLGADLRAPEMCASCHQLTWPGANAPLYDTYGEWQRSPHAAAGVGCIDCHAGPGADPGAVDHRFPADPARAVSLLLDLDRAVIVRGGPPLQAAVTLQNTGAGHAFPTGSPWRGVRLTARLLDPGGKARGETLAVELARALSSEPPWHTEADTRLPAGGQATWTYAPALDTAWPAGEWVLVVELSETVLGEPRAPFLTRRLPLRVE